MMRIIWILLLSLTIGGCSTIAPTEITPPAAPKATPKDRQTALNRIQSWWLNGKIAVQTKQDSGSATVAWTQNQRRYTISLLGPLGSHGMRLSGQPGRVTLQTSDGKSFSAKSPEQLLAEKWGFQLPVSNMNYWIRGLPVPGTPANTQLDPYGRLTALRQQGWNIQYLSYANVNGVDLPEKLSITSSSLRVKIIVYQWRI
ncbi:MAG: lipoprotein insertase outer membrane protein LolB [Gammaproteobacteria bacterium]|nr:lipoprotein insertase outer membrane protein LolB [Gammaproteobacteria bacterium]MCW5582559.1 lipoprotein insertase outer membrane protein LolB [Gammaproteobacteria bacterium]